MQSYSDAQIIDLVETYMHGSDHPDQVEYRKQVETREFASKTRFLAELKRLAAIGDFRGKRILDVGCGFGWQAFTMSLLGNKVTGLDILPSMIDGMTASVATMHKKGLDFDLTPMCGDVCDPKLENGSFDAIYSVEAIEHVHDLKAMFARCSELLRPGGQILLMNDSNVLNNETRQHMLDYWDKREHSWEMVDQLKKWRPVEHADAKPFAVAREDIVRAANPQLDNDVVSTIVKNTPGLLRSQIEDIAKQYRAGFQFPQIGEYDRCRNPETGEYAERLLDPYNLAQMLQETGFTTSIRHCFHRVPLNWLNGVNFRPLNNFLFNLRGVFLVIGQKPV